MRPTRPLRVARMAVRTAGSMTPTTGTGTAAATSSSAAAVAELHATTMSFTSRSMRWSAIWSENSRISSSGRGPYG